MKVSTVNVNGIRAAARKGMREWLRVENPDVILMQEVRAEAEIASDLLGEEWETVTVPCRIKGRAGVLIAVRRGRALVCDTRTILDDHETDADSGRWLEAVIEAEGRSLRVISAYFHSGEKDTPKQDAKMAHLPRIGARLAELFASGEDVLVCGDFNIVRSQLDLKNWTSNHNKRAGVLDEEIAFLDEWIAAGWRDVVRDLAGQVQGPYSWWSQRGKAFDNDAGWRIDYHFATPGLAARAREFSIAKAVSYEARFSDHAPVNVIYA